MTPIEFSYSPVTKVLNIGLANLEVGDALLVLQLLHACDGSYQPVAQVPVITGVDLAAKPSVTLTQVVPVAAPTSEAQQVAAAVAQVASNSVEVPPRTRTRKSKAQQMDLIPQGEASTKHYSAAAQQAAQSLPPQVAQFIGQPDVPEDSDDTDDAEEAAYIAAERQAMQHDALVQSAPTPVLQSAPIPTVAVEVPKPIVIVPTAPVASISNLPDCPIEAKQAKGFRDIMEMLIRSGVTDAKTAFAICQHWAPHCASIQRVGENLQSRVESSLEVLLPKK